MVRFLVLFFSAFAVAETSPRPIVIPELNPNLLDGDRIEIACKGEANVTGTLLLTQEKYGEFSAKGTLFFDVPQVKYKQFVPFTDKLESIAHPNDPAYFYLNLISGLYDFSTPEIVIQKLGVKQNGKIQLANRKEPFSSTCSVTKLDPRSTRRLLGSFVWERSRFNKRLFFQAEDQLKNDSRKYEVVGDNGVLAVAEPRIGKHVRITGTVFQDQLELDSSTMAPEDVSVLCNVKVTYTQHVTQQGLDWTLPHLGLHDRTILWFEEGIPYASREAFKVWSDYYCGYWNSFPVSRHTPNSTNDRYNYRCEPICE